MPRLCAVLLHSLVSNGFVELGWAEKGTSAKLIAMDLETCDIQHILLSFLEEEIHPVFSLVVLKEVIAML